MPSRVDARVLRVTGSGSATAVPDLVRIAFTVQAGDDHPDRAFATATATVEAVRAVLRAHGVPDASVSDSRLRLSTIWTYPDGAQTAAGYRCEAGFVVESGSLDGVRALLVDLIDAGADGISSVDFDVADRTGLLAEAQRTAVAAARRSAEVYAEAAGMRLGAVARIDELGTGGVLEPRMLAMKAESGDPGITPGSVSVDATVAVSFDLRDSTQSPARVRQSGE